MTFTRKKIAAAMAGAAVLGAGAQSAFAIVDIDGTAGATNTVIIANESVVIPTSGGLAVGNTAAATASSDTTASFLLDGALSANAIPDNTDIRVTVTLSGATFNSTPTLVITGTTGGETADSSTGGCLSAPAGTAAPCPAFAVFTGGGTADGSVTFNTNTGSTTTNPGAHFLFGLGTGGGGTVDVLDQSGITATVNVQIADNFGPTDLGTRSVAYAAFAPYLGLSADVSGRETTKTIDNGTQSLLFTGTASPSSINVGGFTIAPTATAGSPVAANGAAINVQTIVGTGTNAVITAANGFAAFNQGTAVDAVGTVVSGTNACAFSTADATIAACAGYQPAATGDGAGDNDVVLTVANGTANTVTIDETTLTATVTAASAAAAYSPANASGVVPLLSLARNGSSARLNFALTPEGNFPMFIRVVNPSAIAGTVTLTLTNDDGTTSDSIALSDIAGGPAGALGAGASTGLLNINDVMTAVQAADADFALGATNKLRVNVSAQFGAAGSTGVILSAFSVSSDGTTFNMMTDASN